MKAVVVLFEGFYTILNNWRELVIGMAVPFLFYMLVSITLVYFNPPLMIQTLLGFISFLIYIVVSVATHRIVLLGSKSVSPFMFLRFGKREWQFLLAMIEVMFYMLPLLVLFYIPHVGEYVVIILGVYIVCRISLIFPSIAIDTPMKAGASWQATKKYQILMFTVVFLYSLFFSILEYVLAVLLKVTVFIDIVSLVFVVFLVGALSVAYKSIMSDLENR